MAIDDKIRTRVRSHLLGASKSGWFELWPAVAGARSRLVQTAEKLKPAQAAWKPASDAWSAADILRHHLVSSEGVLDIITALAAGEEVRKGTYDDPGEVTAHEVSPGGEEDYRRLLAAFIEHSVRFAALPLQLPGAPNEDLTFPHLYFGELNCRAWFAFQPIHDGDHFRGLTALLEHADFPA